MEPITALLIGAAGSIFAHLIVSGTKRSYRRIKRFTRALTRGSLVLVGPVFSGKTAFTNILLKGEYPKEDEDIARTVRDETYDDPIIVITGGEVLAESICSLNDFSAQSGVALHGGAAGEDRVSAILVFLQADELDRQDEYEDVRAWFRPYCRSFSKTMEYPEARDHLYAMIVIITKADKVSEDKVQNLERDVREILQDEAGEVLGEKLKRIEILSGNLLLPDGADFMEKILDILTKRLGVKQSLFR